MVPRAQNPLFPSTKSEFITIGGLTAYTDKERSIALFYHDPESERMQRSREGHRYALSVR
jgi:hypothetical protein